MADVDDYYYYYEEDESFEDESFEDESFDNYTPTTIDPGWWMFGATCIVCVLMAAILLLLVRLTNRGRKNVEAERNDALIGNDVEEQGTGKVGDKASVGTASTEDDSILTEVENDDDSVTSTTVPFIDTLCFSTGGEEVEVMAVTSKMVMPKKNARQARGGAELLNEVFGDRRKIHGLTRHNSGARICLVDTNIILPPLEVDAEATPSDYRQMEEAIATTQEESIETKQDEQRSSQQPDVVEVTLASSYHEMKDEMKEQTSTSIGSNHEQIELGKTAPQRKGKTTKGFFRRLRARMTRSTKDGQIKTTESKTSFERLAADDESGRDQKRLPPTNEDYSRLDDETTSGDANSATTGAEAKPDTEHSATSKEELSSPVEEVVVSSDTVIHEDTGSDSKPVKEKQGRKRPCRALKSFGRKVRRVAVYDNEMKKIFKLAIPYTLAALTEALSEVLTVAVIGSFLGTQALSAFIAVQFALSVTTTWLEGPLDSLTMLCSQAVGTGNNKLAGEYVQIAIVLSQLLYLPQLVLWMFFIDDLILWFGFSEQTAAIGYDYAVITLVHGLFEYVSHGVHNLLEVCDYEELSAITAIAQSVVEFLVILTVALTSEPSLQMVGLIHFGLDALLFFGLVIFLRIRGILNPYLPGLTGSFALFNTEAVKRLLRAAAPLSIAHVLADGEFQLLLLFADFLGPAEVVAWGLFCEIWESIDNVTDALGGAAEVRCSYLLGADKPMRAKHSAQKSLLLGLIEGLLIASFFAGCGGYVSGWMTNDATIQAMLSELVPYICIGAIFDSFGSISFALVGAQGCFGLATLMYLLGSWLVTLPLALLFSKVIGFNLAGFAAAVVVGSTLSGMANAFMVLDSNWYFFADKVRMRNKMERGY